MICKKLVEIARPFSKNIKIKDIRIGLGYTCVLLDNGNMGLAHTAQIKEKNCCNSFKLSGSLINKTAEELIELFMTHDKIETSIGLATINALLNYEPQKTFEGDITEHLKLEETDKVGMIGYFEPIIEKIKNKTNTVYIFEKNICRSKNCIEPEKIKDFLPSCTHVIITSTTLINKTFEDILNFIKNARFACMLGPSTPMTYEFFKGTNIKMLSGVQVTDTEKVMRIISEAGGTPQFMHYCKKINRVF